MTTPARRYARYRWAIYSKLGLIRFTICGLSGLRYIAQNQPHSREIAFYLEDTCRALESLREVLTNHLALLKGTGAWRHLR